MIATTSQAPYVNGIYRPKDCFTPRDMLSLIHEAASVALEIDPPESEHALKANCLWRMTALTTMLKWIGTSARIITVAGEATIRYGAGPAANIAYHPGVQNVSAPDGFPGHAWLYMQGFQTSDGRMHNCILDPSTPRPSTDRHRPGRSSKRWAIRPPPIRAPDRGRNW